MTKADKIRARIARHDTNLSHSDMHAYLMKFAAIRVKGSHFIYTLPNGHSISIPRGKGDSVKAIYLKQLDIRLTELENPK